MSLQPDAIRDLTQLVQDGTQSTHIPPPETLATVLAQRYRHEHTATYIGGQSCCLWTASAVLSEC